MPRNSVCGVFQEQRIWSTAFLVGVPVHVGPCQLPLPPRAFYSLQQTDGWGQVSRTQIDIRHTDDHWIETRE